MKTGLKLVKIWGFKRTSFPWFSVKKGLKFLKTSQILCKRWLFWIFGMAMCYVFKYRVTPQGYMHIREVYTPKLDFTFFLFIEDFFSYQILQLNLMCLFLMTNVSFSYLRNAHKYLLFVISHPYEKCINL